MPSIDLSILNQRQTPAFFADTLANRPAPSYVGRIFISTDTLDLYRDTGSAWLLLSPSSTGTITGLGAAGQVTIFSGASSITGTNNLFWDTTNLRLGINTNTPGASLDVHSATSSIAQFNQTTATNNTLLVLQNSGTALWRAGNYYNAGANDFGIYDVVGAAQQFTIKKTTGQTFIGAETTTSGRLVVNNATGDNHIVVIGATAPSIRINNAGSGATRQIGIGLATTTNNFIQGTTGGEMAIFNASTTASPILFGIYDAAAVNVQEAARISAARNFLIGTTTDAGYKLDVNGAARVTGVVYADNTIRVGNGIIGTNSNNLYLSSNTAGGEISFWANQLNTRLMTLTGAGALGLGTSTPSVAIEVAGASNLSTRYRASKSGSGTIEIGADRDTTNSPYISAFTNSNLDFFTNDTFRLRITTGGNVGIGITNPNLSGGSANSRSLTISAVAGTGANGLLELNGTRVNTNDYVSYVRFFNNAAATPLADIQAIRGGSDTTGQLAFATGNSEAMRITASQNLLIGTTTDAGQKLQVNGDLNLIGLSLESGKSFSGFYMPIYISGTKYFLPIYS